MHGNYIQLIPREVKNISFTNSNFVFIFTINWKSSIIIYANKNKSKWQVFALFTPYSLQVICTHINTPASYVVIW